MARPIATYSRSWTRQRNWRAERVSRQLFKKHDLSSVPVVLVHQFAGLSVRAEQLNREAFFIEKGTQHVMDMDAATFARWSFIITEHRRTTLALTGLAKSVFREQHRPPALDLVYAMATEPAEEVQVAEPAAAPDSETD